MMYAYDEQYLDDAMRNLGEAVDYAANACNMLRPDLQHSLEMVYRKLFRDYQEPNLFTKLL